MHHLMYVCHQNRSGYAQSAQDYIYALQRSGGYEISMRLLHASADQISMTPKRYSEIINMISKESHKDAIQIIHGIPDKQINKRWHREKVLGFGIFETYNPPEHWVKILNENNAVIVPSKFNEQIFREAGVNKPIFYIPHCVDTNLFHPNVQSEREYTEFCFMFFGTWKKRKGWPQLIEAWLKEFDAKDNVRLLIKTDRITMAQRGIEEIRKSLGIRKDFAPISFETKVLNEETIPPLIKKADCLISPTLGEGFGLPGLQAMALGVPVITTNYSGCQDYANKDTATLIEPSGFIFLNELDMIPQFQNRRWAHIQSDSVAKAMRNAVSNRDEAMKKSQFAVDFVSKEFGYEATVKRFDAMLETI